jgi:hypothetical protein
MPAISLNKRAQMPVTMGAANDDPELRHVQAPVDPPATVTHAPGAYTKWPPELNGYSSAPVLAPTISAFVG